MDDVEAPEDTDRGPLAMLLAWVGGYVDAVGYITLLGLFTAHQSGNSVGLGVAIGQGDWIEALRRLTPIGGYVVAIGAGALIVELYAARLGRPDGAGGPDGADRPRMVASAGSMILLCELALLGAALLVGSSASVDGKVQMDHAAEYYGAAALLAGAMGMQTVALRHTGGRSVRTTFVTGVLTNMTEAAVVAAFARRGRGSRPELHQGSRLTAGRFAALLGRVWLAYLGGAVIGTLAERVFSLPSLGIPMLIIAGVIVADRRLPPRPSLPSTGDR